VKGYVRIVGVSSLACALALATVALVGCGSSTPKGGTLEGVTWVLTSYSVDGTMTTPPADAYADATFVAGKVSGRVVNSYAGPYDATDKGGLKIGPLASTQMAGPPELMALETAFFANMQKVASYYAEDTKLTLYDSDGKTLLEFAKSTATITGRDWVVTGYNTGSQAVTSVLGGATLTARFGDDGRLTGNGGVNTYSADYTTTPEGTITIGPIITTKMAGPQELMDQEAQYLAALASAKTYSLHGKTLEFRTADDAIAVTMSE
jgi:heat shock protein HslJ